MISASTSSGWMNHGQTRFRCGALLRELKVTRRCEATVNEALINAIRQADAAQVAKVAMPEKVDRTRHVAERVCQEYHRKAAVATIDKSKLMYLIYCLLGVIVFLLVALVHKNN